MTKRTGKFYYRNERDVMSMLGMRQVPGSGNGWVHKEDGENDEVLCQLKSTDANSFRLEKLDLDKLVVHSITSKKLPVFAVQFLKSDEVYLVMRPSDLHDIAKYIDTGVVDKADLPVDTDCDDSFSPPPAIKSSSSSRARFMKENSEKFKKKERKAK